MSSARRREAFVLRLTTIVNVGGLRLGAVGERTQQEEYLLVTVLRDQPFDVVPPAAPAWLANDCQRRLSDVRQGESVFWHQSKVARRRERSKNKKAPRIVG